MKKEKPTSEKDIKKINKKEKIKPGKKKPLKIKKENDKRKNSTPNETAFIEMNDILKGESKKFEIERANAGSSLHDNKVYQLPEEYGETKITLLIQNPYWIYAFWEFSESTKKSLALDSPSKNPVIRMYYADIDKYFDVEVKNGARSWYLQVPEVNRPYFAEIGIKNNDNNFIPAARSNVILVPTDRAALKEDAVEQELFKMSGGYRIHKLSGSEIVSEWMAVPSGISSAGVSSGSGAANAERPQEAKDFDVELHAEVVLYGKTDPNAKLAIGGKMIPLTKDGKFSVRFYLKNGEFSIPLVASSPDNANIIEMNSFIAKGIQSKEYHN